MYSQKIMSAVRSALVFLRILPSPRPTWTNKLGLLFWMFVLSACYATLAYDNFFLVSQLSGTSPSMVFTKICVYVLWPSEALIVLYQVHTIETNSTPLELFPKRLWHFLLCRSLHLTDVVFAILLLVKEIEWWHKVAANIGNIVIFLVLFGADLVIGCFASQFCKQVKDTCDVETLENINVYYIPIVSKYKQAKEGLEFLLLCVFLLESIILTTFVFAYIREPEIVILLTLCLYLSFHLSYIAFLLDDCFTALKSTLPGLRLTLLITTINII